MGGKKTLDKCEKAKAARMACFSSATSTTRLCNLKKENWVQIWHLAAFPDFRKGTLCFLPKQKTVEATTTMITTATFESCIIRVMHKAQAFTLPAKAVKPVFNTKAFEYILQDDFKELYHLDQALLSETVAGVSAFQYAGALGAVECFAVLMDRLGMHHPLLVDAQLGGFSLKPEVVNCCCPQFTLGNREGLWNMLLQTSVAAFSNAETILSSAVSHNATWLIGKVVPAYNAAKARNLIPPRDLDLSPAFRLACHQGKPECIRLLAAYGAKVNERDFEGRMPIMLAAAAGHAEAIRALLKCGGRANCKVNKRTLRMTPLLMACENGHTDCVRVLLDSGAKIEVNDRHKAADPCGMTPLVRASKEGHTDCVRLLLERGAKVTSLTNVQHDPLSVACEVGNAQCIQLLLEHGADANIVSKRSTYPPLVLCSMRGLLDGVRLLLDHGANVNWSDQKGMTALKAARSPKVAQLLRKRGAKAIPAPKPPVVPRRVAPEPEESLSFGESVSLIAILHAFMDAGSTRR